MQALADALDWDQTYSASPPSSARGRLQLVDAPLDATPAAPPWQDKLQAVPAIRSGLIPLHDAEEASWSKPFSLVKADFEPWLSYYAGYRSSRLFLGKSSSAQPELDYPVRAFLELKKLDRALIVEPPVQIDGPVEYFDASRAPRAAHDRGISESLARAAEAMHRSQLRRAHERGRDMGNQLHDALLGDGLSNLIRAWEKAYGRKPSPHELHIMLTTGRTAPVKSPEPLVAPTPAAAPTRAAVHPRPAPAPAPMPRPAAASTRPETPAQEQVLFSPAVETTSLLARPGVRYLLHLAGAAGAAGLAYVMMY